MKSYHISSTTLLASVQHDRVVWKFEKNEVYSFSSAYRNIMEHDPYTHQHRINGEWHQIWRTKTPPQIKNFLWRVMCGCLPTRLCLQARGVNCPSHCPFCNEDKDNLHVLFMCPMSIQCWQRIGVWSTISFALNNPDDITHSNFGILHKLDKSQHLIFSALIWSMWKHRNNKVWNDTTETFQFVCDRASALLDS